MKTSDELITLFDNLNVENQSYALAILQSLKYAQDSMSKQSPKPDNGERASPVNTGIDKS